MYKVLFEITTKAKTNMGIYRAIDKETDYFNDLDLETKEEKENYIEELKRSGFLDVFSNKVVVYWD